MLILANWPNAEAYLRGAVERGISFARYVAGLRAAGLRHLEAAKCPSAAISYLTSNPPR
jgi:hypothetical protein